MSNLQKFVKKYYVIVLSLAFLILISCSFFFLKNSNPLLFDFSKTPKNSEEIESLVIISQSSMSVMAFGTEENEDDHRVHLNFRPYLNLTILEKEVKEFRIKNFKGSSKSGKLILVPPTDLDVSSEGYNFLFGDYNTSIKNEDINSSGNSIEFKVVENETHLDEVRSKDYIIPNFSIILKDLGSVDYEKILERDSIFNSSKYIEYLEIDLNDLDTEFQFDIEIVFNDNTKYAKRFKGIFLGDSLRDNSSAILDLEIVE